MKLIILDEEQNEINRFDFMNLSDDYDFKKEENISDICNETKNVLDKLNYMVGIYSPIENSNDFYISFLNSTLIESLPLNLNELKGTSISNIFLKNDKSGFFLKVINDVYTTNKSQKFIFDFFHEDLRVRRIYIEITRINDFLYIFGQDKSDYNTLSIEDQKFFENNDSAIAIVQDDHFVKVNKKYLEVYELDSYDDVIGQKVGFTGLNQEVTDLLNKHVNETLAKKKFAYSVPLETKKNGKLFHYFNINGTYIVYNGKPAVMVVHHDITEQEVNKREIKKKTQEALLLQNNMKFIQSVTNTGAIYIINGKYNRSSEFYEIIEREKLEEDSNKPIIKDFVIDEDKNILKENCKKLNPKHDYNDFILRINTAKNNLKYIHIYIKVNYQENDKKMVICFIRDVTDEQIYLKDLHNALNQSMILKNNLEKIQKISKTGMSYSNEEGTLDWTKPSFDTFKLNYDDYKDYHGDLKELIIKEDINNWDNAYKKCSPEHPQQVSMQRIINGIGELIYTKCYTVCDYDENGNEIKHINFYLDITEQIERENQLKESLAESLKLRDSLEKIQGISKTSVCYTSNKKNWYSKGHSILQLDPEEYYNEKMTDFIIEEDQNIWKKAHKRCTPQNPETSFTTRAITTKGELKYVQVFVAFEFDDNGNKISHVSFFQDITEKVIKEKKLQKALTETLKLQKNLNRIQSVSKTAIGYSEGLNNSKWTPEVYDLLEINKKDYAKHKDKLIETFIINEDLKIRQDSINSLNPNNPDIEFTQRIKTGKGNLKYIKTVMHNEYDNKNNLIDQVSFNQDITHEMEYQDQLKTALKDKEILLSEVHHRVKNNLQIILSLINLNQNYDKSYKTILADTQDRIYAMALIHEKIYGSGSLSDVNIKEYIESLVTSLFDVYETNITLHSDIESVDLNMEISIPLGLIINELVNNVIKYAFPNNEKGNLYIKFKKEVNKYILIFKDDGVGLPDDFDLDNLSSLGLIVVTNLTLQIGGTISILDCEGSGFKIEFEDT